MTPELHTAIATARTFQQASGARRVVLILDRGDEPPTMIDVDADLDTEVTEGEHVATVPRTAAIPAPPKPLPSVRAVPASAIEMNLDTGELAAPIGTVEHLAESVLALAAAFGGRTVASAEFATRDPDTPITLAARTGERVVLGAGDAQYEL